MARAMFHVKHEGPPLGLDDAQGRLLEQYQALLTARAVAAGMVAAADVPRLRERHLLDSLRAAGVVRAEDRDAYDVGSGAGLPGVVVAIACPWLQVGLVERRRSRAAFLELVVDELQLSNASVIARGSERLDERVDLVFARALAAAGPAWALAEPLLRQGGRLVYFAGEGFRPEVDLPNAVRATLLSPSLAPSGPLVIMARQ
jgi:16S rRNA (guanine527-N7)-methyltransferase